MPAHSERLFTQTIYYKALTFMSKAMTIAGLVVAALIFLIFGLDIATGIPFGVEGKMMNIGAMVSSAILGYISFMTFRELR